MLDLIGQKTRKCPDSNDNVKWWHTMEKMRCESQELEKGLDSNFIPQNSKAFQFQNFDISHI